MGYGNNDLWGPNGMKDFHPLRSLANQLTCDPYCYSKHPICHSKFHSFVQVMQQKTKNSVSPLRKNILLHCHHNEHNDIQNDIHNADLTTKAGTNAFVIICGRWPTEIIFFWTKVPV